MRKPCAGRWRERNEYIEEKESGCEWLCLMRSNVTASLEINNFSVYIRAGLIDSDSINKGIKY